MISTNAKVHHGGAVIDGTRMSVAQIVRALGSGDTAEVIAGDYGLAPGDVWEATEYAAEMVEAAGGMGPDQVREISGGNTEDL